MFSPLQKFIVEKRLEVEDGKHTTYRRIKDAFFEKNTELGFTQFTKISNKNIIKALARASMGLVWDLGMKGGIDSYLVDQDISKLKAEIHQLHEEGEMLDRIEIASLAFSIKVARYSEAVQFLNAIECPSLIA